MKLFRHIRRKLLAKGKARSYLTYAVGEIVLVVIGILIAVSINNRKKAFDLEKQEMNLYKDLIEELQIDLGEISKTREYNQRFLTRYELASEIIVHDKGQNHVDSLAVIAMGLTKFSDFRSDGTAFQKLNISGKIDLISDNEILNRLQRVSILYIYIDRLEKNQNDLIYLLFPKISEAIRVKPFKVMRPDNLYAYPFHNDIELTISICKEKDGLYEQAEENLESLIELLSIKLNNQ